jgi:integrase
MPEDRSASRRRSRTPLSAAPEVERLAAAIDPMFEALIYSAVYLGCRWGELVGLKRQNLNLLRRQVMIVGTLEEVGGSPPRYVEETKSSRRGLTIPPSLYEILAAHLAHAPESEFVFVGRGGGLLRRNTFRRRHWNLQSSPPNYRPSEIPRPSPYVRIDPHRAGRTSEGDPGAPRTRVNHDDDGSLRSPVPEPRRAT